jgi:hypothetical protein
VPDINQVKVAWTGFPGAPGVSTFYFDAGSSVPLSALSTMFTAWKPFIKDSVTLTFPSAGIKYSSDTGKAVGSWSASAPSPITCTGAAGYAAPVGGVVHWKTGIYAGGKEIRGRTFMVPLVSSAYDADGTFLPGLLTAVRSACSTFASTAGFIIYSRQSNGTATVNSALVPDKAMVLTTRRA